MKDGKIIAMNPRRGMFIVAIDGGDYAQDPMRAACNRIWGRGSDVDRVA